MKDYSYHGQLDGQPQPTYTANRLLTNLKTCGEVDLIKYRQRTGQSRRLLMEAAWYLIETGEAQFNDDWCLILPPGKCLDELVELTEELGLYDTFEGGLGI